jgi:two-component system alkaline phosphatase synthesis response regulator PhoP
VPKVLIVEDDPKIVEAIEKSVSLDAGYVLRHVSRAEQALPAAVSERPDLILLDVRLPDGGDGRAVLKSLKANPATKAIPVIFLTGMAAEGDKVVGLNLGADDYVTKPFGARELLARIEAVTRRSRSGAGRKSCEAGGVRLEAANRKAWAASKELKLQPKEFEILFLLVAQKGQALSRRYLVDSTSSYGTGAASRSLDTHIKNLRRKLGAKGRLIETVPKLGYRFAAK